MVFSEMEDVPEAAFLPPGRTMTVMTIIVSIALSFQMLSEFSKQ